MSELAKKILKERNLCMSYGEGPMSYVHSRDSVTLAEQLAAANQRIAELEKSAKELLDGWRNRCKFTEQWYAERWERLTQLCKEKGIWDEAACIMANGTVSTMEPPTYAVLLNRANHKADSLTAENAKLRELLRESIEWLDYVSLVDRIKQALGATP